MVAPPGFTTGAKLAPIIADPATFATAALRQRSWWRQRHLQRSVARHPLVAVKACHKSSKTFSAAGLVLWWLTRFGDGKVITTSPTFPQIRLQLWPEIRKAARQSIFDWPKILETELRLDDERFALGRSARDELAAAGWSGRILIIIDEAPGVSQDFFKALTGVRAGGRVHVLMLGNPTVLGGPFQDAFGRDRARWHTITFSAWDTPKVRPLLHPVGRPDPGLDPYCPPDQDERLIQWLKSVPESKWPTVPPDFQYLVSPDWILEQWEESGPGTIDWESRVMGRFCTYGESDLVAEAWLTAWDNWTEDPGGPVDIGVDVAGGGQAETVVYVRSMNVVLEMHVRKRADPEGWVLNICRNWKKTGRLRYIVVDKVGLGDGLWKILRKHFGDVFQQNGRHGVWGFNGGESAVGPTDRAEAENKEKFRNLRAQTHWSVRDRAKSKEGLRGVRDPETIGQLTTIRWNENTRGQVEIESKERREKDRGLPSPDRADALIMAFAEPPVRVVPRREPVHY